MLDDKATRGHDLNANEACIFAAILKCTRAGRGWYGNYRELAAAMPFVINRSTVYRAVQKLLNLGLIERREKKLFALLQNETGLLHNATELLQNETELLQNALPPNNPSIYNNMNKKEKEQQRVLCAHDCESQTPSFSDLNTAFGLKGGNMTSTQFEAAKELWKKCSPAKKRRLYEALDSGAHFKYRLDWLISDFPEPEPTWLRGDEDLKIVQVRYNGAFKLCSLEDAQLFNLQIIRQWNN